MRVEVGLHCLRIRARVTDEDANRARAATDDDVNVNFMLTNTFLVFFMQAGFAMLCAGSVRSKNTKNILIKNVLDACVGAIAWFLFGYGFAFGSRTGTGPNAFIGSGIWSRTCMEVEDHLHSLCAAQARPRCSCCRRLRLRRCAQEL